MTPNDRLRQIMDEHHMRRQDVCNLLGLKIRTGPGHNWSNPRLDGWLSRTVNQSPMPPQLLELLEIKLAKVPRETK